MFDVAAQTTDEVRSQGETFSSQTPLASKITFIVNRYTANKTVSRL